MEVLSIEYINGTGIDLIRNNQATEGSEGKMGESPILITGAHRSGTTWLGRVLAQAPRVGYLFEPLSKHRHGGICGVEIDNWFTYVCDDNEDRYLEGIAKMLQFRFSVYDQVRLANRIRHIRFVPVDWMMMKKYRLGGYRPLIKDPIAAFSSEWLARKFGMKVVVVIRHPAAFVRSVLKAGWVMSDFGDFYRQPLLMRDCLYSYSREMSICENQPGDHVGRMILMWRMIYGNLMLFAQDDPNWIFVRHEDLCQNPLSEYRKLCEKLNLPFTKLLKQSLEEGGNRSWLTEMLARKGNKKNRFQFNRNKEIILQDWRENLDGAIVDRIRAETALFADKYYGDEDW